MKYAVTGVRATNDNLVLRHWWIFIAIVAVWNVPNIIPWERSLYPQTYQLDLQERLFKCVLLSAMFTAFFSRAWVAWLTSWLLGLWWLPLSVAVRCLNDSPITANLMGMFMASSLGELMNLLTSMPPIVWCLFASWNIGCAIALYGLVKLENGYWAGSVRLRIFLLCALVLLIPYIGMFSPEKTPTPAQDKTKKIDIFKEGDQAIGSDAELPRAFPYELPWAMAQYWKARRVVNETISQMGQIPVHQMLRIGKGAPEVVVLVIGESSSRKAWSVFNPDESETTPRLRTRLESGEPVVLFTDVVAQTTSTRQAVPSMLTPQPLLWPDGQPNSVATASIISLASQAGYKTAWFSNQAAVGQFDGVITAYADEAQTRAFLNPASFFQPGSYDEILLPPLKRQLAGRDKIFVILHTMGSHFRFEHRYPENFGPFPPPVTTAQAYKNSISYTDWWLDQVMELLSSSGRPAIMVYVSDHGQGLADHQCHKSDINRLTVDAYEVPALVWLSKSYVDAHPLAVAALRRNSAMPYTTAAVYQTLHDFLTGNWDESAEMQSFLRTQPKNETPQLVVAAGMQWVNFKEAANRNPCFIKAH